VTRGSFSLRTQFFLAVTIALIPIAVVSVLQGLERAKIDVANVRERLLQSARVTASSEENALASGEQVLRALAGNDDVRRITAYCGQTLADTLIGVRFASNIARVDRDGLVVCSGRPQGKGLSVRDNPLFAAAKRTLAFAVGGQTTSRVTHTRVIGMMLPLRDAEGRFDGAVSLGVNASWLDGILRNRNLPSGAVVSVFDREGAIVAANEPGVARQIFSREPRPETLRGGLESRTDAEGGVWTFAAAPLIGDNVFVGFAMRDARLFGPTYFRVGTDFLIPIVMIGLAGVAIWFATERQVTQWITYLRRVASAYRGGHYGVRPQLADAPAEFRALGAAMEEMAAAIQDRDKSLREVVAQKTLLIKETHHRVKNNLQIVMSLLNLQSAQAPDPKIREALGQAQARINALALLHKILHEVEDQTTIDLGALLGALARQIGDAAKTEGASVSVKVDAVHARVPSDIAVPIALFTVEALINVFKYAFPPGHAGGAVTVTLAAGDTGKFRLAVADDGVGYTAGETAPGIGGRLLHVFAQQLHGTLSLDSAPGRGTLVALVFADPNAAPSPA
jgi:two-component sensor histidine kinase